MILYSLAVHIYIDHNLSGQLAWLKETDNEKSNLDEICSEGDIMCTWTENEAAASHDLDPGKTRRCSVEEEREVEDYRGGGEVKCARPGRSRRRGD